MPEDALEMNFQSIRQIDVPKGRDGKHKQAIVQLMKGIEGLSEGSALRVPLAELPDSKENIRAALSRATRQKGIDVSTSSDDTYLYIWKASQLKSNE